MKISFSKSEPYPVWKGIRNEVDVFVDGKKIGELVGRGAHLGVMEYYFAGDHPLRLQWPTLHMPLGIRSAKVKCRQMLLTLASNSGVASED